MSIASASGRRPCQLGQVRTFSRALQVVARTTTNGRLAPCRAKSNLDTLAAFRLQQGHPAHFPAHAAAGLRPSQGQSQAKLQCTSTGFLSRRNFACSSWLCIQAIALFVTGVAACNSKYGGVANIEFLILLRQRVLGNIGGDCGPPPEQWRRHGTRGFTVIFPFMAQPEERQKIRHRKSWTRSLHRPAPACPHCKCAPALHRTMRGSGGPDGGASHKSASLRTTRLFRSAARFKRDVEPSLNTEHTLPMLARSSGLAIVISKYIKMDLHVG